MVVSGLPPAHHPGAGASNYFAGIGSGLGWLIAHGPGWAAAHAALGLALVVAALGHDISSLIMAVLWALALACYLTGLYLLARPVSR
jgi:hypothetical protein